MALVLVNTWMNLDLGQSQQWAMPSLTVSEDSPYTLEYGRGAKQTSVTFVVGVEHRQPKKAVQLNAATCLRYSSFAGEKAGWRASPPRPFRASRSGPKPEHDETWRVGLLRGMWLSGCEVRGCCDAMTCSVAPTQLPALGHGESLGSETIYCD